MPFKYCSKNHANGVRSLSCKTCGEQFIVKSKKIKKFQPKEIDWKELHPKDRIKILSGTGPYYEGENGRIYLGPAGIFDVVELHNDGFTIRDGIAIGFCYMGETKPGV